MDFTALYIMVGIVLLMVAAVWVRGVIARGERISAAQAAERAARRAALPSDPEEVEEADPTETPRPVVTHVIERQVVVVRCKFCKVLTPVDRDTCKECGSARFVDG